MNAVDVTMLGWITLCHSIQSPHHCVLAYLFIYFCFFTITMVPFFPLKLASFNWSFPVSNVFSRSLCMKICIYLSKKSFVAKRNRRKRLEVIKEFVTFQFIKVLFDVYNNLFLFCKKNLWRGFLLSDQSFSGYLFFHLSIPLPCHLANSLPFSSWNSFILFLFIYSFCSGVNFC